MSSAPQAPSSPSPQAARKIASSLPRRLRQLRSERGLNIKQVALAAGVAPSTLGQLERGLHEPSLGTMLALVDFYELCSIEELLMDCRLGTAELLGHPHKRPLP